MAEQPSIQIDAVLKAAISKGASDIHLRIGKPPTLRIDGILRELKTVTITPEIMSGIFKAIVPEKSQGVVHDQGGADFGFSMSHDGFEARFRVSAFQNSGQIGLVLRRLPNKILSPEELGLPIQMVDLVKRPRGLILVTGPTGSGKSTTLASLVKKLSISESRHIITIEEPTEYRFDHGPSVVTQREVPQDVPTFREGLRQALRQDPDVIMVGEMRDLVTTSVSISAAETGHLVLSTMHTVSAAKTIDRLIEQFPHGEQEQIRSQISTSLLAVLGQQLLVRKSGTGRVAAFEFMLMNSAAAHLIREGKTEQLESVIKMGARQGMRLLDDELYRLVITEVVDKEEAIAKANRPEELRARFSQK